MQKIPRKDKVAAAAKNHVVATTVGTDKSSRTKVPLKKRFKSKVSAFSSVSPKMHVIMPDNSNNEEASSPTGTTAAVPITISDDDNGCNCSTSSSSSSNQDSTSMVMESARTHPTATTHLIPSLVAPNNSKDSNNAAITAYAINALTQAAAIHNMLVTRQAAAAMVASLSAASSVPSARPTATNSAPATTATRKMAMDSDLVTKALQRRDREELLRANYSMLKEAYDKALLVQKTE